MLPLQARLMWLVESYGEVKQVEAYPGEEPHARCDPSYKERVLSEMASYGNGMEKLCDVQQPYGAAGGLHGSASCWQGIMAALCAAMLHFVCIAACLWRWCSGVVRIGLE